jgi:hypothetical protein
MKTTTSDGAHKNTIAETSTILGLILTAFIAGWLPDDWFDH